MGGYYYGGERRSLVQEFEQFEANPLSLPSIPKPFKPAADRVSGPRQAWRRQAPVHKTGGRVVHR
jgi:hypothetical protein